MSDHKGLSAFPHAWDEDTDYVWHGMTLRDWFAGQALAGLASNTVNHPEFVPPMAYKLADAMLVEREKEGE